MKIFNSVYKNNIAFERNLAARASVLSENGDAHSVKIYHLNKEDDVNCLKNVINNANWQNNFYLEEAAICFPDDYESEKDYVMEDESGELLCYGILNCDDKTRNTLKCIETMPSQSCYSDKPRRLKYVGETMLSFFVKQTQCEYKDFYISAIEKRPKTEKFYYNQCGFKPKGKTGAIMELSEEEKFISSNEHHTKNKIELIA